jgi:hypothetical protein
MLDCMHSMSWLIARFSENCMKHVQFAGGHDWMTVYCKNCLNLIEHIAVGHVLNQWGVSWNLSWYHVANFCLFLSWWGFFPCSLTVLHVSTFKELPWHGQCARRATHIWGWRFDSQWEHSQCYSNSVLHSCEKSSSTLPKVVGFVQVRFALTGNVDRVGRD